MKRAIYLFSVGIKIYLIRCPLVLSAHPLDSKCTLDVISKALIGTCHCITGCLQFELMQHVKPIWSDYRKEICGPPIRIMNLRVTVRFRKIAHGYSEIY